jgi:predicted transcriptional regulator
MTAKQDFYPLPGFPIESKFTSIDAVKEYLHGDRITCLICGRSYKGLAGHISKHGISSDEYKERFGLPFKTGLTSSGTKVKLKVNGSKNIPRLEYVRSMIDRVAQSESSRSQRTSGAKILQAILNIAKAPVSESPFTIEDAITIFRYMVDFNVSLNQAVKATGIMKMTAFWNLLKRYPEELIPEYEEARSKVTKGKTNPLIKTKDVIDDVRGQRAAGIPRKVIAEKYGIHVEYVSILELGYDKRTIKHSRQG